MRISTSQLYESNINNMSRQQSEVLKLQNQLSTGSRVVNPSDDPVAAARALEISQATAQVAMYKNAQGDANDKLSLLDSQLGAFGDLMKYVHERAIQAGNGTLNQTDREAIATDMQAQFDALKSIANSTDANGEYLFAGYKSDTLPFSGGLAGVSYAGDQGQRTQQVSSTRDIPVSISGDDLFMNINAAKFYTTPSASNTGTATVTGDTALAHYTGGQYAIRFTSATAYEIYDTATDPGMTGTPAATGSYTAAPTAVTLPPAPATGEIQVDINGTPVAGDTFEIKPNKQDAFSIISDFIDNLKNGGTGASFQASLQDTLSRASSALDNSLRLRAQVGSRQIELESLGNIADDMKMQYADRTERLIGLDYAETISQFQQQQTFLQASQSTFVKTTSMSLFNLLS
ncbi:flagellar hook-associated protein FlgL [Uliginosibacterium sediminicola]|uniref:Flagellar hook-associated protein FlgL n=1 Tax=Uliginosibacterium sediminicola TaxID=2024550 RepID=A0ABU9Z074_9RHOO